MINKYQRFFGGAEWEVISKLGNSYSDPEQKKAFWNHVREAKEKDPRWSIFDSFPDMRGEETKTMQAMREAVESVKARKTEVLKTVPRKPTELEKLFGEVIEIGGHKVTLCLWPKRESA